jgi:poly-gamma-glutamate synthase PgsB/CapB
MTSLAHLSEGLDERLLKELPDLDGRLRRDAVFALASRVVALTDGQIDTEASLVLALVSSATESDNRMQEIRSQVRALGTRYEEAPTPSERARVVRQALEGLEPNRAKLVKDLAAMRRHLDLEALVERFEEQISDELDLQHLAYLAATAIVQKLGEGARRLDAGPVLDVAFGHASSSGCEAVVVGALRFSARLLAAYPEPARLPLLGAERFRKLARLRADDQRGAFPQVGALELSLAADPAHTAEYVAERLADRDGKDGAIVRQNALRLLAASSVEPKRKLEVARRAVDDPSEHVRQGLSRLLASLGTPSGYQLLSRLWLEDQALPVQGVALRELSARAAVELDAARALEGALLSALETLARDPHTRKSAPLVDLAIEAVRARALGPERVLEPSRLAGPLASLLQNPTLGAGSAERLGALLLELEVRDTRKLDELRQTFADALRGLTEGDRVEVEFFPETPLSDLEKALAVVTQDGLPVAMRSRGHGRYTLSVGERRGFRFWRLIHELLTPAPDKRMGYAHTSARVGGGDSVIAPLRMGEVTPTRVPGERHLVSELGTWGSFLPRVDDLLAVTGLSARPRRVVTSFGTLELRGPPSLFGRLVARARLSWNYPRYATLRDVSLSAKEPEVRLEYAETLGKLGLSIALASSDSAIGKAHVERKPVLLRHYLGASFAVAPLGLPHWLEELGYTIASPRSNTAWHLALVVWLVTFGMLLRAALIRSRIERHLARIPLRIGGWGSRGKSGSERIKAALFHAMRFDVVVKTTGCEAMMIHARRDRSARELFLYRPYDKATIWEQERVVGFGARLRAQVFLWECMALQPRFVSILMDEWMQDKLATLTNAYPDHEDIMGPSGEDVARVIGCFMPKSGVVFSAEEQMLPLIRDAARLRNTRLVEVGPLDAALLPRDLLARFPYNEHPSNIAMVLALAEHLGVDREWALVKMGDHVVPDLGVLKTYPTIDFAGRKLTFSNGMSANERAGFLSNWIRLGFDEMDGDATPDEVSVSVVNNRADRVPRSHVFAQVMARDAICDHIVLIGTNLDAMQRFIINEMDGWLETVSFGDGTDPTLALERAHGALKRLRISTDPNTLRRRLTLVLTGAGATENDAAAVVTAALPSDLGAGLAVADLTEKLAAPYAAQTDDAAPGTVVAGAEVKTHIERLLRHFSETHAMLADVRTLLEQKSPDRALQALRAHCRKLWAERIVVIWDAKSTGDQTIDRIARTVPPGHRARVLGCQNIKGTGLDFAYRWVSIGDVDTALRRLEEEPRAREQAIAFLRSHGDYGLSDARMARKRIGTLAASTAAEWQPHQAELGLLLQHLGRVETARAARLRGAPKRSRIAMLLDRIEPVVDHLDSVRRSGRAARIMDDLFEKRVSQGRAAVLLRDLVARGKGGWLASDWTGKKS